MTVADRARDEVAVGHDGIVHIRILGMWTLADVDRFFADLMSVHSLARDRHGRVRTLIEIEAVQSPVVVLYVRKRALAIKGPDDRNAVLVATMLSKLQIKRLGGSNSFAVFTDRRSAREWLLG